MSLVHDVPAGLHKNKEEDLYVTAQAWKTVKGQHKSRIQEKQIKNTTHPSEVEREQ